MEQKDGLPTFQPSTPADWRAWLEVHHATAKAVWLIMYKKASGVPSINWSQAVDEALCFGWIDAKVVKRDEQSRYQYFTRRNPKSTWSRINKAKVEKLVAEGRMTPAGQRMVDLAKETGTWTALDDVEDLKVPDDLQEALEATPGAAVKWEALAKSLRRAYLQQLLSSKRAETRVKKIGEIVGKVT